MAKSRKIRDRQKAVKSIRSVTRTMEMVATARYRKVHGLYAAAGPYIDGLSDLLQEILVRTKRSRLKHPLLREPKYTGRRWMVVLTSNRGLCGGYNASILRTAIDRHEVLQGDGVEVLLYVSGKRGIALLNHRGYSLSETTTEFDGTVVPWRKTADLADRFLSDYLSGNLGGVDLVYGEPVGAGGYRPVCRPLLPLPLSKSDEELPTTATAEAPEEEDTQADDEERTEEHAEKAAEPAPHDKPATKADDPWAPWEPLPPLEPLSQPQPPESPEPYEPFEPPVPPDTLEALPPPEMEYEFVPSADVLLKRLLPNLVRLRLFRTFLQSAVTEQQARIAAMRSASENAEDMIDDLKVKYNRNRQSQITTELAEILGGRAALE